MRIVYLDQNKWIELARAAKYPTQYPDVFALLNGLFDEVAEKQLVLPLTFSNIYETQKVNDPRQRHELALIQSALSQGVVFRGRYKRLQAEIGDFVRSVYCVPAAERPDNWFLSDVVFESVMEIGDKRLPAISEKVTEFIRSRPADIMFDYLTNCPEEIRKQAVRDFSEGLDQLRRRIEARRSEHASECASMRRNIYGVLLMIGESDLILEYASAAGAKWESLGDAGGAIARRMMFDVPTYHIEREITMRIESQKRDITENDFRDMQSFCAALAYSDIVVAEKHFSSLAMQAGLDKKCKTLISTDLLSLSAHYPLTDCAGK